jgi:hypothetical protein
MLRFIFMCVMHKYTYIRVYKARIGRFACILIQKKMQHFNFSGRNVMFFFNAALGFGVSSILCTGK